MSKYDKQFMNKADQAYMDDLAAQFQAAQAAGDTGKMSQLHQQGEAKRAEYSYSGGSDGSQFKPDYASLVGMSDLHKTALADLGAQFQAAQAAGDTGKMSQLHQQGEDIRALYGYSGGGDGSEYIPTGQRQQPPAVQTFSYQSAPTYVNKYQDLIDELSGKILKQDPFSYDAESDPLYQQYRQSYTRGGERAMQDTMGQLAARTGGLASSYAGSVAQQTYDGYMSALADKIPELQQLAYSMYQDEGEKQRLNLQMISALEQEDYARYQDLLSQYNTDRSFSYNQYRDQISDDRYADETAYNRGIYAGETAYNRGIYADETDYDRKMQRARLLAEAGDFSGYQALGYSNEEVQRLQAAYLLQHPEMASLYQTAGSTGGSYVTGDPLTGSAVYSGGGISSGVGAGGAGGPDGKVDQGGWRKTGGSSGSSGSSGRGNSSSSGSGSSGSGAGASSGTQEEITSYSQLGKTAQNIINHINPDPNHVATQIQAGRKNGTVTEAEAEFLLRSIGY